MLLRSACCFVLSAVVVACGGQSTSDGSGGSSGSGGATGGSGGALGGSGGTSVGGAGGAGGVECSAELQAKATLGGYAVGFEALPGVPGPVMVASALADELVLSPGPGGGTFSFKWFGPDLSKKFANGEMVSVGSQDGWDYVAGDAHTAVARRDLGFVAPQQIPAMPYYGPHLGYAAQCSYHEGAGACGQPPASVSVFALEATTGAGALTIAFQDTETFMGWEITNVNNVQFPGYSSDDCVLEAGFSGVITAVGPALDKAQ